MKKLFFLCIFLVFFGVLIFAQTSQAAFNCTSGSLSTTCYVTTTQAVTTGTTISGAGNLVIQNNGNITCTNNGTSTISMTGDVTIQSGGSITCNLNNLVAANLNINSGGIINVNGKGYAGGSSVGGNGAGPGGGQGNIAEEESAGGGGGGYGGAGGSPTYGGAGGSAYGSSTAPTDFGSGGGGAYSWYIDEYPGTAGGGAVKITVSGTVTINGSITANGANASDFQNGVAAGTGSGGSVYIIAGTITGSGTTTANGGNGNSTTLGGTGSGGRIYMMATTWNYSGVLRANGGTQVLALPVGDNGSILPYMLRFNTQPATSTAVNTAFSPQPVALIQNLLGATVTSSTSTVSFSIGTNPSGGILGGVTSFNATSGVATSTNLSINLAGDGYTLVVSATGMISTTSNSFNITAVETTPTAPTIVPPTVLSSTIIRWNFVDNSDNETGFMAYSSGSQATSSANANLTYLDQTGLTPNTQYTSYINAYNDYGLSASSTATSTYTLAPTPTGFNFMRHPLSLEIYVDSFPNDTVGSAGYLFWRTDNSSYNSTWIQTNTWQDPNMVESQTYTYAVKYRNSSGTETATSTLTGVSFVQSTGGGTPLTQEQPDATSTLPVQAASTSSVQATSTNPTQSTTTLQNPSPTIPNLTGLTGQAKQGAIQQIKAKIIEIQKRLIILIGQLIQALQQEIAGMAR